MRKLRQLSMAVVLTFAFATFGFADAGIIPTVPGPNPAPEPPSSSAQVAGITQTPPSADTTDPVVAIALDLLQTVLSVF